MLDLNFLVTAIDLEDSGESAADIQAYIIMLSGLGGTPEGSEAAFESLHLWMEKIHTEIYCGILSAAAKELTSMGADRAALIASGAGNASYKEDLVCVLRLSITSIIF